MVICHLLGLRLASGRPIFRPNHLRDFGGLKWLFVICSANASQVVDPFFARTLTGGGLKWTRTIDLTLIRRVL